MINEQKDYMKTPITKYIIGGVIVAVFAAYAIFNSGGGNTVSILPSSPSSSNSSPSSATQAANNNVSAAASGTPPANQVSQPAKTTPTVPITPVVPRGEYKDGSYNGSVEDAFYGNLQVAATIQNGKLADIQFPQYPSDNRRSQQISNTALPILKQEAISAQSANVDVVSGATQVSEAFQQSLATALALAK
jgi:uncharacterized protein with FMN-binding domain